MDFRWVTSFVRRSRKPTDAVLIEAEAPPGLPFDPCSHQLCDTLSNISEQGLEEHKDAAVHAILTFAQTTLSIHGTNKGSAMKPGDWKGDKLVR